MAFENDIKAMSGLWAGSQVKISIQPELIADETPELKGGLVMVPLSQWWSEVPTEFKAFLNLEANQKNILYCKPGSALLPESLERFELKGVKYLGVAPEDYSSWKAAENLLKPKLAA